MINIAENEILLRCSCHLLGHVAWLIHEPDDDDFWFLTVMLDHFSFWRRLRIGIRYIFAPSTLKCMSAEIVLQSEDVDELVAFILERRSTGGFDDEEDPARPKT